MDTLPDEPLTREEPRRMWLPVLSLWLAVILLPMALEISGLVLGSVFFGIVLIMAAVGPLMRRGPEPFLEVQAWNQEFKRMIAGAGRSAALIVLLAEALLIARAWGERTGASWLPQVKKVQDWLYEVLAPFIPALGELPAAMAKEGFPDDRVSIVGGAFAITYVAAVPLMVVFMRSFIRQLILHWRFGAYRWIPDALRGRPFKRAFFLLMSLVFFAMVAHEFMSNTAVARLPGRKETYANFETNDVDLIYRALDSLVLTSLTLPAIVYGVILIASQARYTRLHPEWFQPSDQEPPQVPPSKDRAQPLPKPGSRA